MIFTKETLALYGKANSPMVLKDQYKTLVRRAKLDKEIEKNVSKIVAWLKAQKPETGLDAQNLIIELVSSGDIEKFINTAPLKTLLYEQGKSSQDYDVILSIYLFEQIIPEVIED